MLSHDSEETPFIPQQTYIMEAAKDTIKNFLHHGGKQHTDVHETTAPAVTDETVKRTHEEKVTTAVDREVHQDHHHTTIQPVKDTAVKAEQHHHNAAPVQERVFEHGNQDHLKNHLASEQARFKDTSRTIDAGSTTTAQPTLTGEHVHHHVHANIQPVIQRETIEPHITHTTVPVHEVHHNATKVHDTTTLPAMSREEFEKLGGSVTGGTREHHHDFAGEPRLATNNAATSNNRV